MILCEDYIIDAFQTLWLTLLAPFFLIYGLFELGRGWKILRYGQASLNVAVRIRILIVKLIKGEKAARQFQANIVNNTSNMQLRGVYSILGGSISVVVSIIWLLVLFHVMN